MENPDSFYRLAKDFCQYVQENEISCAAIDALISALMKLYISALELPDMQPDTGEAENAPEKISIKISRDLPTLYWEVFDPLVNETPVCVDLYDDLSDIVRDLKDGISAYEHGRIGDAVFNWRFGVMTHWGDHTVNAIRALHRLRFG